MTRARRLVRGGVAFEAAFDDTTSLLDVLRRRLGSAAVPRACTNGRCGVCRVLVDGRLVSACVARVADVEEGATIEISVDVEDEPYARRAVLAFDVERPTRCRLCVGGLAVAAASLARGASAAPTDEAIEGVVDAMACMCTGRGSLRRSLAMAR